MLAGFVVGALTSLDNPIYTLRIADFGVRLLVTAGLTLAIWVPVMLLTRAETDEKLDDFYRRVRPAGPGWKRQRARTGLAPDHDLRLDLGRTGAGILVLFGVMFAIGGVVLLRPVLAVVNAAVAVLGLAWLRRLRDVRPATE